MVLSLYYRFMCTLSQFVLFSTIVLVTINIVLNLTYHTVLPCVKRCAKPAVILMSPYYSIEVFVVKILFVQDCFLCDDDHGKKITRVKLLDIIEFLYPFLLHHLVQAPLKYGHQDHYKFLSTCPGSVFQ